MQFLRFVAGPLAASLLILAPASIPVFAQDAPVQAPATSDDMAYQAALTEATTGVTDLLAQKDVIDARIVAADANTDYAALVGDLMTIKGQWQAVTDRVILLQPTPRYVNGNLHTAIATQTFAEAYGALANSFTTNDATALVASMQTITAAKGLLNDAGLELLAA